MASAISNQGKFKIGLVVNEFFCDEYPPLGGFGLAARNLATFFNRQDEYPIEVVGLLPPYKGKGPPPVKLHDTRILQLPEGSGNLPRVRRALLEEKIDLLISIDYYPNYFERLIALPRTPWMHWVRDPRSPDDWAQILQLQKTSFPCEYKEKSSKEQFSIRQKNFVKLQLLRRLFNRKFCCGIQELWLRQRAVAGFPLIGSNFSRLVNRIDIPDKPVVKADKPRILFIGRLLPVKRPWVYFEIARQLPDMEFLVVGDMDDRQLLKQIVDGARSIPNLSFLGNRVGCELERIFASSWLLVNTSIHEGMPQSILQALSYEIPIVSSLDFGGTIDRYGLQASKAAGDGMAEVVAFCASVKSLVQANDRRRALGRAGLEFIKENYTADAFQKQFFRMLDGMGLCVGQRAGSIA